MPSAFEKQVSPRDPPSCSPSLPGRERHLSLTSLFCLKRFVPSLLSQGSAKLEKAEILQMTVDHLKMLHTAGGKGKVLCVMELAALQGGCCESSAFPSIGNACRT